MKVILFMATSLNGMIATKDGQEEFLSHKNWQTLIEATNEVGNLVIGRRTLDMVRGWDVDYGFDDITDLDKVILTRDSSLATEGYITATSPTEAIDKLKERGHESILVTGGSQTNSLFSEHLTEIRINIEPVLLGEGIPLFAPADFLRQLRLLESKNIGEDIVQLRYEVL